MLIPSLANRRNIRVAFIGDSISRYMYLALAAYLKDGEWYPDGMEPSVLMQGPFKATGGWPAFYHFSNEYLRPFETCDCIRVKQNHHQTYVENHYYLDHDRNNYIYSFQK